MSFLKLIIAGLLLIGATANTITSSNEQPNILVQGEGDIQITSSVDAYENIQPNIPINGTIMITRDAKNQVDENSFRMGDKPINVQFVQTTSMSIDRNLVISIYDFQIGGLPAGQNTLPPISVKVGDKEYQAPPLIIDVGF